MRDSAARACAAACSAHLGALDQRAVADVTGATWPEVSARRRGLVPGVRRWFHAPASGRVTKLISAVTRRRSARATRWM
jgi:hypothetical protein